MVEWTKWRVWPWLGRIAVLSAVVGLVVYGSYWLCTAKNGNENPQCGVLTPECVSGCVATTVFLLYAIGLVALFAWLIYRTWNGEIDLLSSIRSRGQSKETDKGSVSLSKMQIFLWTIVLVFAWLYQLVRDPSQFPVLPSQALMLLGLSGATYLGSKQVAIKHAEAKAENELKLAERRMTKPPAPKEGDDA